MAYIHNYIHHDGKRLEKLFEIERSYDNLSIVNSVGILFSGLYSTYHRYCLFASYPGSRLIVEPKDLMQNHGDHECSRPKTDFKHIRIIQQTWRNYEQRPESVATKIWNDLKADDKKFLGIAPHKVNCSGDYGYIDYKSK
nr:780_t:CDS:2 [Entrophospora candida]